MPNSSRQKGDRFERQLVDYLQERRVPAERIPLSGSSPFGSFSGYDLDVTLFGEKLKAECKHIGGGFKTIYGWLAHGSNDFLIIRSDRAAPLAVVPLELLVHMSNGTLATRKKPKVKSAPKKKKKAKRKTKAKVVFDEMVAPERGAAIDFSLKKKSKKRRH